MPQGNYRSPNWRVGLFVPCYINQFYPSIGIATLQLLDKLGMKVDFPIGQTCCGQPMANAGFENITGKCNRSFLENFHSYDFIVSPSGSCVLHIKEHLFVPGHENETKNLCSRIFELSEFLNDILKIETIESQFPYRVGLHQSCHGQRGLHISQMSELVQPYFSKSERLLSMVSGLELVSLSRSDECCGFGGTFCVTEEAVSVKMGKDRVKDHIEHGVEFITGNDASCLMHLEGILRRQKSKAKIIHLAEILNSEKL